MTSSTLHFRYSRFRRARCDLALRLLCPLATARGTVKQESYFCKEAHMCRRLNSKKPGMWTALAWPAFLGLTLAATLRADNPPPAAAKVEEAAASRIDRLIEQLGAED